MSQPYKLEVTPGIAFLMIVEAHKPHQDNLELLAAFSNDTRIARDLIPVVRTLAKCLTHASPQGAHTRENAGFNAALDAAAPYLEANP